MNVGIMQPYFFPYIGYFQLMNQVDEWVIFDDIQFIDKGWVNRNRILHPDESKEWQYITLPLSKRGQFDKISQIQIDNTAKWRDQILGKLTAYKKKAPYYRQTVSFVNDCFAVSTDSLSEFLKTSLTRTALELGIDCRIRVQSEMQLELGGIENPGQWALKIAKAIGADEYINPHGGFEIFDEREYQAAGVELKFLKSGLTSYSQRRENFVPGLSIIDVLMWNSPQQVKQMLETDFKLYSKAELEVPSES